MTRLRAAEVALRAEAEPVLMDDACAVPSADFCVPSVLPESITSFSAANGTLSRQRPMIGASLRAITSRVTGRAGGACAEFTPAAIFFLPMPAARCAAS